MPFFSLSILTPLYLLAASLLTHQVFADPPAFWQDKDFELGKHGIYSEVKFESSPLVAPRVNFVKWEPECDDGRYFFLSPRGLILGHEGPMILDQKGHMVWHREDKNFAFPKSYGVQVQQYKGKPVITFWAGDDNVVGHGSGFYYIFDQSYRLIKKVDAIGPGVDADLHEFRITAQDTALLTSYIRIPYNIHKIFPKGPKDGYIFDCVFQEIDLETNQKLFEWHSIDHFGLEDCYNPLRRAGTKANPWDYFHINSVDKDNNGDYIISSRYSHAVSKISKESGKVLWNLGGKHNSFTDLSDGKATNMSWQHDARWQDDYTSITLFNNAEYFAQTDNPSYGLKIKVDQAAMTAEVINAWHHPDQLYSESQGSVQMLPNGNAFIGYGAAAAMSEFRPTGELVCDVHYGAMYYRNGNFSPNAVVSYRTFKQPWQGFPYENPRVKFLRGSMFVSWNGATEVKWWTLEGSKRPYADPRSDDDWQVITSVEKQGFETNITVVASYWLSFRLSATNAFTGSLGSWSVYAPDVVQTIPGDASAASADATRLSLTPSSLAPTNRGWFLLAVLVTGTGIAYLLFARRGTGLCLPSLPSFYARNARGIMAGIRLRHESVHDVEKESLVGNGGERH